MRMPRALNFADILLASHQRLPGRAADAESPYLAISILSSRVFQRDWASRCDEVGLMEKLDPSVHPLLNCVFPDAALPHVNLDAASQAYRSANISA